MLFLSTSIVFSYLSWCWVWLSLITPSVSYSLPSPSPSLSNICFYQSNNPPLLFFLFVVFDKTTTTKQKEVLSIGLNVAMWPTYTWTFDVFSPCDLHILECFTYFHAQQSSQKERFSLAWYNLPNSRKDVALTNRTSSLTENGLKSAFLILTGMVVIACFLYNSQRKQTDVCQYLSDVKMMLAIITRVFGCHSHRSPQVALWGWRGSSI